METIRTECRDCGGTGLYSGMCEGRGEAVICLACQGTGCKEIRYKPYTGRKGKRGILTVRQSAGRFIGMDVGGCGEVMTYSEFQSKIPQA